MRSSQHLDIEMTPVDRTDAQISEEDEYTALVADWRDVLPQVDVPTWVVTGRLSPYCDVEGMHWFANEVPDGTLTIFEESGHSPHVSEAEKFNRQLLDFVASDP